MFLQSCNMLLSSRIPGRGMADGSPPAGPMPRAEMQCMTAPGTTPAGKPTGHPKTQDSAATNNAQLVQI